MGTPASEPSQRSGKITVADKTENTQSIKCTQVDWSLAIVASAEPGRARALLQLGGDKPIVKTVNIENIDGLRGVAGGDIGKAEASTKGSRRTRSPAPPLFPMRRTRVRQRACRSRSKPRAEP